MQLGETNPELRRIILTILVADGSGLATNVDGLSPTVRVAKNSSVLVAAGGTFAHLSNETRLHYYEASAAEALVPGFLLVVITHASIQTAIGWAPVGQIFALGETDPAKLRLPITIYNTDEPPALSTGATVTTAADLRSSVNARMFADDPGSLVEIDEGAYFWQATSAAVLESGFVTVRYESAGFGVCLAWTSVEALVTASVVTPPVLTPLPLIEATAAQATPIDMVALALSRLPSQYRVRCDGTTQETNNQKVIRILLSPAAELEAACLAVLTQSSIETAVGAQLTVLGKRVGRPRNGITDDDIYRRYVRAQISANKSDGIIGDILTVARLVLNDPTATLKLRNTGTAAFVLEVGGIALPTEIAAVLMTMILRAVGGGVRPILEYSTQPPENVLRWTTQGIWSTGLWSRATDREIES